ncbi:hypothetical protein RP20_CCG012993 [Aedes albopictus]|nr:hypothetical protein RP20_CCG012993 [Aedes albopictus]
MKHALFLSLLAVACTVTPAWIYFPEKNGIMELDPSNYFAAVRQFPYLMVEFYIPRYWCPNCQIFASKYENAALAFIGIKLAQLDASRYAAFAEQLKVQEYPSIYFYRQGQMYELGRRCDEMPRMKPNIKFTKVHATLELQLAA